MKKFLATAIVTAALALPASAQDTIKIGVITDKTGSAKFYAEPVTEGVIVGAKEINAKGGVLGKKIELLIEDDQNKPDVSSTVARKLVDAGVVFLVSNTSSTATQQAQSVSKETKTPHITPANSGDTLTTQIDNPYFFQTGPLASYQIATLMAYTRDRKFKKAALMSDNSELGQLIAKAFRAGLEKNGVEIVAEEIVQRGATTAVPQLQKVRAANPEAIFQAGVLGSEMVLFFRAYHQLGMKTPILGSYNLSIPLYLTMAKDLMDGIVIVDAYDPDKPEVKHYAALYEAEFKRPAFNLPAYGYDGIHLGRRRDQARGRHRQGENPRRHAGDEGFSLRHRRKGHEVGFPDGKRSGFDPNGIVIRLIENNQHGKVVFSGQK